MKCYKCGRHLESGKFRRESVKIGEFTRYGRPNGETYREVPVCLPYCGATAPKKLNEDEREKWLNSVEARATKRKAEEAALAALLPKLALAGLVLCAAVVFGYYLLIR